MRSKLLDAARGILAQIRDIVGTNEPDVLEANAEGDRVFGLGGDDILSSRFNDTTLDGGAANDLLNTDLSDPAAEGLVVRVAQFGGAGDDSLSAAVTAFGDLDSVVQRITLAAGSGDDRITARSFADGVIATATHLVDGGSGDDQIATELFVSVGLNSIRGGAGDDIVVADTQSEHIAGGAVATNRIWGGDGDDNITATAFSNGIIAADATNELFGGGGHDFLRAFATTASNASGETRTNLLRGGAGADFLFADQARRSTDGSVHGTNALFGGSDDDTLEARIAVDDPQDVVFSATGINRLEGGHGADLLTATVDLAASGPVRAINALHGGSDDDVLTAIALGTADDIDFLLVRNTLRGGGGDDRLLGRIASETGQNRLFGGDGDDRLTAIGGTDNVLDGGAGNDVARGSTGRDTFVFDLVAGRADVDQAISFDGAVDRLQFLGMSDEGTPGLVDDLDAVLRVLVDQPGGDLILGFHGRSIVFRDLGTGTIDSVADLVDDPATQLVPGDLIA